VTAAFVAEAVTIDVFDDKLTAVAKLVAVFDAAAPNATFPPIV
jgi:hypothetical protein